MKSGASQTQPAETILAAVFCAALAALDLSGYPAALLPNLVVADINPIYFTLMLNQWFLIAAGLLGLHFLCPHWALGLKPEPFTKGLRAFWPSAAGMLAVSALGFSLGLLGQYNNRPSAARVLYVNADFDTIEKPSPTGKRLKRAQKQGSRGQSLTSEALFCYVEGCSLPLW